MKISDVKLPPSTRLAELLEQLPHDEVFTGNELSIRSGIHHTSLRRLIHTIPQHVVRLGSINYYGTTKAIAAFKKHHQLN